MTILKDGTLIETTNRPVITGKEFLIRNSMGTVTHWVAEAEVERLKAMSSAELIAWKASEDAKYW